MGFAFPKEERDALIASEPHKFLSAENDFNEIPMNATYAVVMTPRARTSPALGVADQLIDR
jgi:hypothetical protein